MDVTTTFWCTMSEELDIQDSECTRLRGGVGVEAELVPIWPQAEPLSAEPNSRFRAVDTMLYDSGFEQLTTKQKIYVVGYGKEKEFIALYLDDMLIA